MTTPLQLPKITDEHIDQVVELVKAAELLAKSTGTDVSVAMRTMLKTLQIMQKLNLDGTLLLENLQAPKQKM